MVCTCNSKRVPLKKPTRLPPAPPPPPRTPSLSQIFKQQCRLQSYEYSGAESECCSEGVHSVASVPYSTRSLQPARRPYSPASQGDFNSASSSCGYYTSCSRRTNYYTPCCTPNHPEVRYAVSCCGDPTSEHPIHRQIQPSKPKERIRPRLTASPLPYVHRKPVDRSSVSPSYYTNHMELYIHRLFKYLTDRKRRLLNNEKNIVTEDKTAGESIRNLFAISESSYLRSMRVRCKAEDFSIVRYLGGGVIGSVNLVRKRPECKGLPDNIEYFAMKQLKKDQVFEQNHVAHVMAERDIMLDATNDWIVKLYCSFQDESHLYFILEFVQGGDLMARLQAQDVFSKEQAQFYMAEISLAVQFVHDMNFIHRDLKPDNILIDRNGHIKLADFGLCMGPRWTHDLKYYTQDSNTTEGNYHEEHPTITRKLTQRETAHPHRRNTLSQVGSPNYIAPEVLRKDNRNKNKKLCDWWSVGVILYEMVVGYCPFIDLVALKAGIYNADKDPAQYIQYRIMNWKNHLSFPRDPNGPPIQPDRQGKIHPLDDDTINLIKGLLCDPEDRLCQNGVRDIQNHNFFKNIDWENIRGTEAPWKPSVSGPDDTSHFEPYNTPSYEPVGDQRQNRHSDLNDFTMRAPPYH